jgi:hypothetical protein
MRKSIITSVGLAVGLCGVSAWADSPKEVIATNRPTAKLTPVAAPTPQVAPVSYLSRAQKDDKPVAPTITTEPPAAPVHMPGPSVSTQPFVAAPFDPSLAPLPGGAFNEPGPPYRWYGSFEYLYWFVTVDYTARDHWHIK